MRGTFTECYLLFNKSFNRSLGGASRYPTAVSGTALQVEAAWLGTMTVLHCRLQYCIISLAEVMVSPLETGSLISSSLFGSWSYI